MKKSIWIPVAIGLITTAMVLIIAACSPASPADGTQGNDQTGYPYGGGGMMGPGMGGGGMMGGGMMGGGSYNPNAEPITMEQATEAVRRYLNAFGGEMEVAEVMEFAWNFYAEVEEKETGIHAMELLIDRYTGQVYPEMGPNMMWNTKYGSMGRLGDDLSPAAMPINPEQATTFAQQYLDRSGSGLTVTGPDAFYGYYTLHTLKDGQVEGMLSVNGYTGSVWYHSWHGPFIQMTEFHGDEEDGHL
jgi:hypothetical protein